MGILDRLFSRKITIEQITAEEYEMKYKNECRYIWQSYVPQSGCSNHIQGELLRRIEKLRDEAQRNGNINWRNEFSEHCSFICQTLCGYSIFSADEKLRIRLITDFIDRNGRYAQRFNNGEISDDDVDIFKLAYTEDNIYDYLSDMTARVHLHLNEVK